MTPPHTGHTHTRPCPHSRRSYLSRPTRTAPGQFTQQQYVAQQDHASQPTPEGPAPKFPLAIEATLFLMVSLLDEAIRKNYVMQWEILFFFFQGFFSIG